MSTKTATARPGAATPRPEDTPGRYLTDGVRLYRVVEGLRSASGRTTVGLEDCRSLEVVLMPDDELRALRLRPVNADPA